MKKPFIEHLSELRGRVLVYTLSLVAATFLGLFLNKSILEILTQPIDEPLYYSSPTGSLDVIISVGFFFGFLVSLPVLIYQVLRFIAPAFPQKTATVAKFLLLSAVFMFIGIAFAYFVSLPATLFFLEKFSTEELKPLISTSSYFPFVTRYIFGFGIFFQLPVILLFLNAVKRLSIKALLKQERWVIILSFIVAGILTPTPDALNQLMMAVPIILLYQISVLLIYLSNKS